MTTTPTPASQPCRNVLMRVGYKGVPKSCPRCGDAAECPMGHARSVRDTPASQPSPAPLDIEQQTAAQVATLARPLDLAATLQERTRFEAQMQKEGVENFTRRPSGRYDNMVLEWIWLGWRGHARAGAST